MCTKYKIDKIKGRTNVIVDVKVGPNLHILLQNNWLSYTKLRVPLKSQRDGQLVHEIDQKKEQL